MRRHVIALVLGIVLLLALSTMVISCVPPASSSTQSTDGLAHTSDITSLQSQVSAQNTRIDGIAGKQGIDQATAQKMITDALAGYEKKTDVPTDVAAYLAAHPVTPANTNNSSSSSNSSQTVATNKDLELRLTKLNPDTDTLIFSDQQSIRFDFDAVNNNGGSSRNFEVTIYLYPQDTEKAWVTSLDIFSDVSLHVTGTPVSIPGSASADPIIIKCTNGWVGKGDITSFTIAGVAHVEGSGEFDYDYSIRQTN